MIDVRVGVAMSEMNDEEWAKWEADRNTMLAYRHAREFLSEMGFRLDDPRYLEREQQLFNERLDELEART